MSAQHSSTQDSSSKSGRRADRLSGLSLISNRPLGSQLSALVALGLFSMVLSVSIGTSIIINQSLTNNFVQNGRNIAGVLAEQAALPVLLGNPEGARQAIDVVRTFPSVSQVAIYELDGNLLAQSGEEVLWHAAEPDRRSEAYNRVRGNSTLEYEGGQYWQFSSPVQSDNAEPDLTSFEANRQQQIGFVRVLISKDQLYQARNNIILGNIVVLLGVAVLLLLALRSLSVTLTKPLEDFVATMTAGARGGSRNLRVDLSGSRETQQLSNAFNQMMQVLEDREIQLATARDHALAAAKLKSEFAANVSHEIRTPLNGILGTLNLLNDTGLGKEQRELISLAESSSEALMILINDILDFSRLSLDQSTLTNTEFDLYQLLEELMFLHAQSVDAGNLDVLAYYDADLPFVVESDPNKLRQLLNNLINNAVKFTDHGSVMISARKETDAEGKLWIRLSVRDTGIGISEKDLHTIFLPYSQSDGSMSRKYSGTGLGLAICDKLAELLHGDIGVHSELGSGSEFYVRIPFSYRAEVTAALPSGISRKLQGQQLLVFAGSPEIHKACQSLCALQGLQARLFTSLQELEQYLLPGEGAGVGQSAAGSENAAASGNATQKPLLMFYFSRQNRLSDYSHRVAALAQDYDSIVVAPSDIPELAANDNVVVLRSPLRASAFTNALARLLNVDVVETEIAGPPIEHIDLSDYHILLVEDNIVNQRVAKSMLEKLRCIVSVAETGVEALEIMQQQDFDLIYMDCQMPRMNGFDASRAIRQMGGSKGRTPIVAMTANVGQQDRAHCFDAGMNDFLSKPVKLNELSAVTQKWIFATGNYRSSANKDAMSANTVLVDAVATKKDAAKH